MKRICMTAFTCGSAFPVLVLKKKVAPRAFRWWLSGIERHVRNATGSCRYSFASGRKRESRYLLERICAEARVFLFALFGFHVRLPPSLSAQRGQAVARKGFPP